MYESFRQFWALHFAKFVTFNFAESNFPVYCTEPAFCCLFARAVLTDAIHHVTKLTTLLKKWPTGYVGFVAVMCLCVQAKPYPAHRPAPTPSRKMRNNIVHSVNYNSSSDTSAPSPVRTRSSSAVVQHSITKQRANLIPGGRIDTRSGSPQHPIAVWSTVVIQTQL